MNISHERSRHSRTAAAFFLAALTVIASGCKSTTQAQSQPDAANSSGAGSLVAQQTPSPITLPVGTQIAIRLNDHISVKTSQAGDHFTGVFAEPVSQNNIFVIPQGANVTGVVAVSHRRGHFKGRSELALRLTSVTMNGQTYSLDTRDNVHTMKGKGKRSAALIGGTSGAGMLIGGIATGGVGLVVGGLVGAGAGTGAAGLTGNHDIDLPAESVVHFTLAEPLTIQM